MATLGSIFTGALFIDSQNAWFANPRAFAYVMMFPVGAVTAVCAAGALWQLGCAAAMGTLSACAWGAGKCIRGSEL